MKTVNSKNGKNEIRNVLPDDIKSSLGNPELLETLYRDNRKAFRDAFDVIYPDIAASEPARFWRTRLDFENRPDTIKLITFTEIIRIAAVCLVTVFLIKIPALFGYNESAELSFYQKNAAIIVVFGLTIYTFIFNGIAQSKKILATLAAFIIPLIYMNLLPSDQPEDAEILAYIHLPLLMWFIYGAVYTGYDLRNTGSWISYIRFNGDFAIIYAIIAIAGGILTAITIGLFDSIGMNIEEFYMRNIVLAGAAAAPIIAAWLIKKFPALVSKAAPLIAGLFSPLVLITLIVFLITVVATGKDPYNDREFLIVFNGMLLGVMAIILFSVSETSLVKNQQFNAIVLLALSLTAIIADLIALSAIFYRLGDGLTPNRLAVLVSNVLVLVNLVLITKNLISITLKGKEFRLVEITVAKFLPVYVIWVAFVVFGFPLIFGM